jgi:protein-tyrosine phosphatase
MLYRIAADLPGTLSIMARPLPLQGDLAAVKAAGVDTVISLLEPDEAAAAGIAAEADTCAALGLIFLNHPVRDMQLPEPESFAGFAVQIANRLLGGACISLHCYASIGRSGMLACTVLGHFGYTPDRALAHVSAQRGTAVPDTAAQAAFIHRIMTNRT